MNPRPHRWLPYLLLAGVLLAGLGWQLWRNPVHEERDVAQERLDQATAPLGPGDAVRQTFVSQHAGLSAIETLLAVYQDAGATAAGARITLTLEPLDAPGAEPVHVALSAEGLTHNQRLRFAFPPLADSHRRAYQLTLRSEGTTSVGFWHTLTDAYADGEMLTNDTPQPGDLFMVTSYRYSLTDVLRDVVRLLRDDRRYFPAALLLLLLPGIVLALYLLPDEAYDAGTWLAIVVSLSLVTWPVLLLWCSAANVGLAHGRVWVVVALLIAAALYRLYRQLRAGRALLRIEHPSTEQDRLAGAALALVLIIVAATRLVQIRDLVVPAWVDSVHHTVISRLIADGGIIPSSYRPFLPVDNLHYHFGFHANAATFAWLGGLPVHQSVLLLGQLLNVAAVLSAHALATWLTRQRWAGVIAALVAGILSTFPAYYVSWGRYTQLAGLVLLPPACVLAARLLERAHPRTGQWACAALLAAGIFLTHYRVLIFYLLLWPIYLVLRVWRERRSPEGASHVLARALALGALALLTSLPWIVRLVGHVLPQVDALYGGWASPEGYNDLSVGLLTVGWGRWLLYGAGAGAILGLLRRNGEMIALTLWVGLWFLAANLRLIGLADLWLLHNSAVIIALWLPTSVLCGWLVVNLWIMLQDLVAALRCPDRVQGLVWLVLAVVVVGFAGWKSWQMVDVVNPITVLTTREDVAALAWAAENTPPEAHFLINTRVWQGDLHSGTDAGWWLPLLANRETTLPCVLYYQGPPAYVRAIRDLAQSVEEAPSLSDPLLIRKLAEAGVTHVFVGARGGKLMPKELDGSPYYHLLYRSGPTRIYALAPKGIQ